MVNKPSYCRQSVVRFLTCRCFSKKKEASGDYELAQAQDEDVIAENDRVGAGEANADLIVLDKLTKVYDNGKVAVNNMSLGIPPGQCFGLLGKHLKNVESMNFTAFLSSFSNLSVCI